MMNGSAEGSARARDAWSLLGLVPPGGHEAGAARAPACINDDAIRDAYLRAVKEHPPDRDPASFERIRDAYEVLKDPRRRAQLVLEADPCEPFAALAEGRRPARVFAGAEAWLAVLREGGR